MRFNTVVCLASGPSLTKEDTEKVRLWRGLSKDRGVFVINTTYQMAPWADVLFCMDHAWWKIHIKDVANTFQGAKYTLYNIKPYFEGLEAIPHPFTSYGNSGAGAINLADHFGAKRVVLLGYDCHHNGKAHWHGDHPQGLGNANSFHKWPRHFRKLAENISSEVINCTRETSLDVFRKEILESVIKSEVTEVE
jgi:hypothetical protein